MVAWRPNNALGRLILDYRAWIPGAEVVYTIADDKHSSTSDHAVDPDGTVDAGDFMPGVNATREKLDDFAEILRVNKDRRVKYVIRRQRIFYGYQRTNAFTWQVHTGEYHDHCHVSTREEYEDDGSKWDLTIGKDNWTMNNALNGLYLPSPQYGQNDAKMNGYGYVRRIQTLCNLILPGDNIEVDGDYGNKTKAMVAKLPSPGDGSIVDLDEWMTLYGLMKGKVS